MSKSCKLIKSCLLLLDGDYDIQSITLTPSQNAIAKLSFSAPSSEKVSELTAALSVQDYNVGIDKDQGTAQIAVINTGTYLYTCIYIGLIQIALALYIDPVMIYQCQDSI